MKLTGQGIASFLADPPADIVAVLVYGPDEGLVRERAGILARKVVEDPNDPFRAASLTGAQIKDDPALLADEAAAISLTGGKRLVRVREAGEDCAAPLSDVLSGPVPDAMIVIEAGDLSPRSGLRKLAEGNATAAAIPCYVDGERDISQLISEAMAAMEARIESDALAFAARHLGADRMSTRSEIDKLVLYAGPGGRIGLDDIVACVGDAASLSLEDIAFAVGDGDLAGLVVALDRARAEAVAPVTILRTVGRHFQRLDAALAAKAEGADPRSAMSALRPPVFFKRQDAFRRQMERWPRDWISLGLTRLNDAEVNCKTTGLPDRAVAERMLMEMARAAARR